MPVHWARGWVGVVRAAWCMRGIRLEVVYIFFFFSRPVVPEFLTLDVVKYGAPDLLLGGTSTAAFNTGAKIPLGIVAVCANHYTELEAGRGRCRREREVSTTK